MWHERVGSEVFGQAQFSEFKRLNLRLLAGAGLRFQLFSGESLESALGVAYMTEIESLDLPENEAEHPREDLSHRLTSYLTIRAKIQDYLALVGTTYVQPRLSDFADLRVIGDLALEVSLSKSVKLVESFGFSYDSRPPDTVETTDISTVTKLRLSF